MMKIIHTIWVIILVVFFTTPPVSAADNLITVWYDKEIGDVNKRVFGNNIIAYDPMTYEDWAKEYYGYSDYGAGIWMPQSRKTVKEVVNLAREAGISVLRFPGGCGTHHYNWKNTIGKKRKHFLYGIDEFLKTCEEIGAEPIITLSYFTGDEQDAADLVEYLNAPHDGSNRNGSIDWAAERAKNGHPKPYQVKYFEVGNEVWHGDHRNIKAVLPGEYGRRYLKYYEAMKRIDPAIEIGTILRKQDWNREVLEIIQDKIDFAVIHTYPAPAYGSILGKMPPPEIFSTALAIPMLQVEYNYQEILKLLREKSNKDVPLAITEYNGKFLQENPVPYRHCLGTALLNAELLRIFLKPENRILMANYWNFNNGYTGMIKSKDDFMKHNYQKPIEYVKRPNYYVYELYHKHFGDKLLDVAVSSESYIINPMKLYNKELREFYAMLYNFNIRVPYLSVNASKDKNDSKLYIMVINRDLDKSITSKIVLQDFLPAEKASAWILNGPGIDATNEKHPLNVRVKQANLQLRDASFEFTFEPHSLTALEIERMK